MSAERSVPPRRWDPTKRLPQGHGLGRHPDNDTHNDALINSALLTRLKGELPPSPLKIMSGEVAVPGKFHNIALQIVVTANAVGMPEDKVLALSEGLIQNHASDGTRYNTPAKRRAELQRLMHYTAENPLYEYRRHAIRAFLPQGMAAPDLDGMTEEVAGEVTGEGEHGNSEGLLSGMVMCSRACT